MTCHWRFACLLCLFFVLDTGHSVRSMAAVLHSAKLFEGTLPAHPSNSEQHCWYRQCGILYASVLAFQTPQLCSDYWPDWVQSGLFSVILLMICSFCQLEAAALGTYILKYVVARAWCGTPTLLPERTWHDLGVACQGSQITNALYRALAWIWRLGCAYRLCNLQYDSTYIL